MPGLRDAILALAPTAYWPMDDGSGPAASDASGNGNFGIYQGNTVLQLPGPESGTNCAGSNFPDAGAVLGVANPIHERTPSSMLGWFGSATWAGAGDGTALHIGTKGANGLGLVVGADRQVNILYGGLALQATGLFASTGRWHQLCMTYDGFGSQSVYLDTNAPYVTAGRIPNPTVGGDPLVAETPGSFYLAHCAFWNRALAAFELTAVFNAVTGPVQQGPFGGSAAATTLDIASIAGKLDIIENFLRWITRDLRNAP